MNTAPTGTTGQADRLRAAMNNALTERKPGGSSRSEEVFLTPRIIDAGAYSEYADTIRSLLAELDARAATLTETSTDTDKLCAVLRKAAQQLKIRIDIAAKADRSLEARAASAQRVVTAINDATGNQADLDALAERIVTRRQAALEARVTKSLASLEASLETKLSRKLADAERRASDAERHAADLEKRTSLLSEKLLTLTQQADTIDTRATESLEAAETAAERATANALEATEQLRTVANSISEAAKRDTADIESKLGPVRDLLDNASTLADKIAVATSTTERLETANDESKRQIKASQEARESIAGTIDAATESLASLSAKRVELRDSIEEDIDALASEISPLERATSTLRRTLDELTDRTQTIYNDITSARQDAELAATSVAEAIASKDPTAEAERRITALQEAAQAITDQTLKQVEEAAEWLAALAAQTHPTQQIQQDETA